MLPSKLKRKIAVEKGKLNGKGSKEEENVADAESDYESDQVSLCFYENMCSCE